MLWSEDFLLSNRAMDFHQEIMGYWEPDPAAKYAEEYHETCDAYDITICGPDGVPKTTQQSIAVNKHAKQVLTQLSRQMADEKKISELNAQAEITRAIQSHRYQ